jgi:hypothetical protein
MISGTHGLGAPPFLLLLTAVSFLFVSGNRKKEAKPTCFRAKTDSCFNHLAPPTMNKTFSLLLSSFLFTGLASAELFLYEGFSSATFTSGATVHGSGSGSGWSGNWVVSNHSAANANRFLASAYSLGYSDGQGNSLLTTPGSLAAAVSGSGASFVARDFATGLTGEVWISFLTVRTGEINWGWELGLRDGAGNVQFLLQNNSNTNNFRINAASPSGTANLVFNNLDTSPEPVGQLYVLRVTNVGSGSANSNITLWANPNDLTDISAGAAATVSLTNRTVNALGQFSFLNDVNPTGYVDEIRVGSSFASITPIPEPRTYALIAGGLFLGLALYRRRR